MPADVPRAAVPTGPTWRGGVDDAPRFRRPCLTFPAACRVASAFAPAEPVARGGAVLVQERNAEAGSGHIDVELVVSGRVYARPLVINRAEEPLRRRRARDANQQERRNTTCNLSSGDAHGPTVTLRSRQVKRSTCRRSGNGCRARPVRVRVAH